MRPPTDRQRQILAYLRARLEYGEGAPTLAEIAQSFGFREPREALWATEQTLRAGCCAAVVCWLANANDRALRRLAVAAEAGRTLGFVLRPHTAAVNPSPAALRIALDARPARLRVLKCRGGLPPAASLPLPVARH